MISEEQADLVAQRIIPTQDEGLRVILRNCVQSTKFFAQTFLQETFDGVMTYQHDAVWDLIDDETIPKTAICAWRGFGKSSTIEAKIIKSILFRQHRFAMYVSKSHDFAATETETIKQELLVNSAIREVFGSLKAQAYSDVDLSFSRKSWFACDPKTGEPICFIVPKGANQQVRGSKVRISNKNQRPTFIGIDDLEDDEEVLNEDLRKKLRRWFTGALEPCVDPRHAPDPRTNRWVPSKNPEWTPPWRLFYIDTLKHQDANMAHLLDSSDWQGITFPQAELRVSTDTAGKEKKEFFSLVPEIVSHAQVRRAVDVANADGNMDEFAREKLCLPMAPDSACWTPESFQHYNDGDLKLNSEPDVFRFIIVDPAKTSKQSSAFTAILGVAIDRIKQRVYLRDLINARMEPELITDKTFEMAIALNTRNIAVETAGLGEIGEFMFENAAAMKGISINWEWLNATLSGSRGDYGTGKDAAKRVRGSLVLPLYRAGVVWHDWTLKRSALERQMLSFPLCKNWDALDCAGYIPEVMKRYGISLDKPEEKKREQFFEDDAYYNELDFVIENRDWAVI